MHNNENRLTLTMVIVNAIALLTSLPISCTLLFIGLITNELLFVVIDVETLFTVCAILDVLYFSNWFKPIPNDKSRAIFLLVLSGCCDKFLLFTRAIFVATTSCD